MTEPRNDQDAARAALDRLPTPEHRAGFWDDLDRRLNDERRVVVASPRAGDVLDLRSLAEHDGIAPRKARRRMLLPAAAVVLLVGAIAATLLATREDRHATVTLHPPSTSTTVATTTTPATPAEASATVLQWLERLAAGDMRGAWDLLGPTAREGWGSYDAFAAARSGFAEGMATWLTAANRKIGTATVTSDAAGAFYVVTITGTRQVEGNVEDGVVSIVVREDPAGRLSLEPFSPQSAGLTITPPASPSSTLTIQPPTADGELFVVLDRDGAAEPVRIDDAGSATFRPPGGWTPGRHVATAVMVTSSGTPMSAAVVFDIANATR
jgi:hypothetical protein